MGLTRRNCCLVPETLVPGPDGVKSVDEIKAGDKVYSYLDNKLGIRTVSAAKFAGRQVAYAMRAWPDWFSPTPISLEPRTFGPFQQSYAVTKVGDVVVVPTPGHTPHHFSVIVKMGEVSYFLAGGTSYSEALLVERTPDGVSPRAKTAIRTLETILSYAAGHPTVYLPPHDPDATEWPRNQHILSSVC